MNRPCKLNNGTRWSGPCRMTDVAFSESTPPFQQDHFRIIKIIKSICLVNLLFLVCLGLCLPLSSSLVRRVTCCAFVPVFLGGVTVVQ